MLSHEFTKREKILLLICAILFLGFFYYEVVYRNVQARLADYNTDNLVTEIQLETAKSSKISQMQRVIEDSEGKVTGDLSIYNNQSAEITAMGEIFDEDADNVSLSWSDPVLSGTIVRRDVTISFHCTSYQNFRNVLKKMSEMQYRCLIRDVTVSGYDRNAGTGIQDGSDLNASIQVTFFETTEGASNLSGLTVSQDDSTTDETLGDELENRAQAYSN
ncbi:MAG: hypothetical protein ACI4WR_00810 [Bulleidia sp.]